MNIEFINPFTQNALKASNSGLSEQNQLAFPFKNVVYGLDNADNYGESFGFSVEQVHKNQVEV